MSFAQHPLPEVVVIMRDQESLNDLKSMEKYILEELNVRSMKLTTDRKSFGVTMRAEPDHRIGARLRSEFKRVTTAIQVPFHNQTWRHFVVLIDDFLFVFQALTDGQLESFLADGQVDVLGHTLGREDLRIFYYFTGDRAAELAKQYETQSEKDVS